MAQEGGQITGTKAKDYAACVDSTWIDYTKGLGAPVGASLAGSKEFIKEAWRQKQMLGGSMRQSGVIAWPPPKSRSGVIPALIGRRRNARTGVCPRIESQQGAPVP